jgi:hypothetical protein
MSDTATLPASTDTSDADMLAAAMAADEGRELPAATPAQATTSAAPESPGTSAASDESADTKALTEDASKATQPAAKPTTDAKPDAPAKPETAFQKATKEAERKDRSWKAFDAEKTAFREEKTKIVSELESLRREVTALRTQPAGPTEPAKDEHGLTAAAYERAAKRYEDEGDANMANLARNKAEALKQQQPAPRSAAVPNAASVDEAWKAPEFQQRWAAEAAAIVQAEPALGDPANPIFKAVGELVNNSPFASFFKARPDGIRAAVEVAKLQQAAAQAETLRKEVETSKAEIARLTKLTSLRGSLPSGQHPSPKALHEMSSDEADAHVRALAASADRGA